MPHPSEYFPLTNQTSDLSESSEVGPDPEVAGAPSREEETLRTTPLIMKVPGEEGADLEAAGTVKHDAEAASTEGPPKANLSRCMDYMDKLMDWLLYFLFASCCSIHSACCCGHNGTCCCMESPPNCIRCLPTFLQIRWYRLRIWWSEGAGADGILQRAPDVVKGDRSCILAASKQWGHALKYAADPLKANKEVVLEAVTQVGCALQYAADPLKADKDVVLAAVIQESDALRYVNKKAPMWKEKQFVLSIVKLRGYALHCAANVFKADKEVALAAVANWGDALNFVSKQAPMWTEKDFVTSMVKLNGNAIQYAADDLKSDRELNTAAFTQNGLALKYAADCFKSDKDMVMAAVTQNGDALKYAADCFKLDEEVVLAAVTQNCDAWTYAADRLKSDKEVAVAAVTRNGTVLRSLSDMMQRDKQVVMAAIKQHGPSSLTHAKGGLNEDADCLRAAGLHHVVYSRVCLKYMDMLMDWLLNLLFAPCCCVHAVFCGGCAGRCCCMEEDPSCLRILPSFLQVCCYRLRFSYSCCDNTDGLLQRAPRAVKSDRICVYAAAKRGPTALCYVNKHARIWKHQDFVLSMIELHHEAFLYAADYLKSDKDFVFAAVTQDMRAIKYVSDEAWTKKDFVLNMMTLDGNLFRYAADHLKSDKKFVVAAVTQHGAALQYAANHLKADKEVSWAAVTQMGDAVKYVDKTAPMWSEKDFVLPMVKLNGRAFKYVSKTAPMWSEKDFVLAMVKLNGDAFEYVDKEAPMWTEKDFVLPMVELNGPSLKYAKSGLNQDGDCLKASGLWDADEQIGYPRLEKAILSVKFSHAERSTDYATEFALAMKSDPFLKDFKTYNPTAWCQDSCDPNLTNIRHLVRGTSSTCAFPEAQNMDPVTDSPSLSSGWRLAFRAFRLHQEESKATNGFMVQVEEREGLGDGQNIEAEMAKELDLKIFRTYTNLTVVKYDQGEYRFNGMAALSEAVKAWYASGCSNNEIENIFVGSQKLADDYTKDPSRFPLCDWSFKVRPRHETGVFF